jgi:hypothetical protein
MRLVLILLGAAAALAAPPAAAQSVTLGVDRRGDLVVRVDEGRSGWSDPRRFWGDYGFDEYCPRRGWRTGSVWTRDPWGGRGQGRFANDAWDNDWDDDWDDDDRRPKRRWSSGGYSDEARRLRCDRTVRRQDWNGRPAFVSVRLCVDRSGRRFVDLDDQRFVGWVW